MKVHTSLYAHTYSFCREFWTELIVISTIFSFEVPLHKEIFFCWNAEIYMKDFTTLFLQLITLNRTLYSS